MRSGGRACGLTGPVPAKKYRNRPEPCRRTLSTARRSFPEQGLDPEVAKNLGHADEAMVAKVYGHVAPDTLQEAMASLDEFARAS